MICLIEVLVLHLPTKIYRSKHILELVAIDIVAGDPTGIYKEHAYTSLDQYP